MGTIILWLASFKIPSDVLENQRLKMEIQAGDGHAAFETLQREMIERGYCEQYREISSPAAHLEFAILVERFGKQATPAASEAPAC